MPWQDRLTRDAAGHFVLDPALTRGVPVRLFLTEHLLETTEENLLPQILNACAFPGVRCVVVTPDVHYGYGVPVGCAIATDGTLAMGPVGFDIGCGMMAARSSVPVGAATSERRLAFNREVMRRVEMGAGGQSRSLKHLTRAEFEAIVRGGADHYVARYGAAFDRSNAERHRIPVDDDWDIPWGGRGKPERGVSQVGSLGGGNHFMELQADQDGKLWVMVHTGSRGFGHGLTTNFFQLAKQENPALPSLDLGYFTPDSRHWRSYRNAVAAGGNFAIVNRLVIFEQVARAFFDAFGEALELVYEISHNLAQLEPHPEFGDVWVHRKGATRAFPAGHPLLAGTRWERAGHPVLIPGSNQDRSFVLRPAAGAAQSLFSVNHGAGRRMSRSAALRELDRREIEDQYRSAGILVNTDGRVPIDEAGPAYKPAREVVDAVVGAGLATVEFELRPLASLKGTDERGRRRH
ncbi:MAG TPA: RtcB family protein [Gemmatimonadales bacterium]|nr:RtcB family protein [Gemmatimonadales bacterium]